MKSVMLSIRPEWCEKIASAKKTLEVRKTRPKIPTPFKCYIYCTNAKDLMFWRNKIYSYCDDRSHNAFDQCLNGKVIGEFVCDYIDEYRAEFTDLNIYDSLDKNVCQNTISKIIGYDEDDDVEERQYITGNEEDNPDDCEFLKNSCLTFNELRQYIG